MNENFIGTEYDLTKKSKIKKFYNKNKILIYSSIVIFFILIGSFFLYLENKKKAYIALSNNYIEAKMLLDNGKKDKSKKILTDIIYESNTVYSTMSLFLILKEDLIQDKDELNKLYNHILKNNKFDDETKNLVIFKKILFQSDFSSENELLMIAKPLLNTNSIWAPHTLILLGDYFVSKNEFGKAKEFYLKVLSIKNLQKELYERVNLQLSLISND